jgi:hypothetical protein
VIDVDLLTLEKAHAARIEYLTKIGIKVDPKELQLTQVYTPPKPFPYTEGICTTRNYNKPPFHVYFEEITAAGWNNEEREVSANICIKLPYGFGGEAPNGSYEYVSFFVNWTPDVPEPDYQDLFEYVGSESLMLYDNPNRGKLHSSFHVRHKIYPPPFCMTRLDPVSGKFTPNAPGIVWIRALLSWAVPVINPSTVPVWGNWFDAKIELAPVF